jgi:uncharacterized protein (DUF697 family)
MPRANLVGMLGFPKLPDMWRILKEADLTAIRREAERPFQALVVAETLADAERLGILLSGPEGIRHPWLLPANADEARHPASSGMLDLAIVVSPAPDLPPALGFAADALRAAKVPLVTVVHGSRSAMAAVVRPGEAARAAVPALDAAAVPAVAQAVLSAASPGLRLALARHLVPLRDPLFAELIEETARTNAMYAFTTGIGEIVPVLDLPLNLADIIVLTKNQLVMSYRIALAAGKKGTAHELIGEVLGVIGGGFLFRQGARQLVGLIPVAGIVPKVAVAYAGTLAIGKAVAAWAARGQALEAGAVKRLYRQALSRGRDVAQALVAQARKRAPRRRWLRGRRG